MTDLMKDVARYEAWLHEQCDVVEADLDAKHERMDESPFVFLRATYFRWSRTAWSFAPELKTAPKVLCVGDTHVENFGTWRDGDGRLVWGVNDFDEAAVMPYALDLVRLGLSAKLSSDSTLDMQDLSGAILSGYMDGLLDPRPVLLEQGAKWFRTLLAGLTDKTAQFWKEVDDYPSANPPGKVRRLLLRSLPEGAELQRFASRRKGGGGLGRPRYLAIADWQGGRVLREAKAAVPSAWDWAQAKGTRPLRILDVARGRHRSPDAALDVIDGFVVRRIAPDARKLDLADVSRVGRGEHLLAAMATEIGAIHAAHRRSPLIVEDLARRSAGWLLSAMERAEAAVRSDHAAWMERSAGM